MLFGLVAAALLSAGFPAWRLGPEAPAPACPGASELEAALAAQLGRSATPSPTPAWTITVSESLALETGPGLEVSLRDPAERLRLRRSVPGGARGSECADVADAVAFIVERFLRDLDWEGPSASAPPERLSPSPSLVAVAVSPKPAPTVAASGPPPWGGPAWRVLVGGGLRDSPGGVVPHLELGVERSGGSWRAALSLSAPLQRGMVPAGRAPDSLLDRHVWLRSWTGRGDAQLVWRPRGWELALGPEVLVGLDVARGDDFWSQPGRRFYVAAGMSTGAARPLTRRIEVGVRAFADVVVGAQALKLGAEVAEPGRFLVGGLFVLSFSFFP